MSADSRILDAALATVADGAALVLDAAGLVVASAGDTGALLGAPASGLRGRGIRDLLPDPGVWESLVAGGAGCPRRVRTMLSGVPGGAGVPVRLDLMDLDGGPATGYLLRVLPVGVADLLEEEEALLRAMFTQSGVGLVVHDSDLRLTRMSPLPRDMVPPPTAGTAFDPKGARLSELLVPEDAGPLEERLRRVADTGVPLVDEVMAARLAHLPQRERTVKVTALRLESGDGALRGVAVTYTDITEQERSRWRSELVTAASTRLGRSLDVGSNAQTLADVLVPGFADLAAVDLTEAVLVGTEPSDFLTGAPLRRLAVAAADGGWPTELYPVGATIRIRDVESEHLRRGAAVFATDLADLRSRLGGDPEWSRLLLAPGAASFMVLPLHARGHVLGAVGLWRKADRAPFTRDDVLLAEDIGSRAALAIDNARRYSRERRMAETLQRSLLPRPVLEVTGAETAGIYLPGRTAERTGGSWFDVITLPSTRVAFVVGCVSGHGLNAAAAMGRLRTAVRTLADLDPAPEELLTHLDDLVVRLEDDQKPDDVDGAVRGATCLYAVYDPVTGRCLMASAGHPPPVLAPVDGGTDVVKLAPGPALGTGGTPFETAGLELAAGDVFAFSAGALADRTASESDPLLRHVRERAQSGARDGRPLTDLGRGILTPLLSDPPEDDSTLLLARLRTVAEDSVATWEFPSDPSIVSECRAVVVRQLARWDLDHLAFPTELIVSELVTNAIRYAGAPVGLRLIKDQRLICEVSDPSQTQPHLRRALVTDEGGRGLFLVAQVTHRWGSRYTGSGKTIWTEQLLEGVEFDFGLDLDLGAGLDTGLE
ncbi:SpoIIE family protein phosphatase [Streptomyces cyaneofuscatus]|uniref:SpoIIE family protein phosphatase n=1 Tax=Streptomyces cyaneofuscatus TaxID=66883 RepID=UPI0037911FF3